MWKALESHGPLARTTSWPSPERNETFAWCGLTRPGPSATTSAQIWPKLAAQVEYWRTLAEYRERRLVERQESPEAKTASRHDRIRLRA